MTRSRSAVAIVVACVLGIGATTSRAAAQTAGGGTATGAGSTDGAGAASTTSTSGSTSSGSTSTSSGSTSTSIARSTSGSGSTSPSRATATSTAPAPAPAEEEDEGDGRDVDFLWIEAFGGIANVNLVAFGNTNFAEAAATGGGSVFDEINSTGPLVGGALGFRVYWIAVGARTTFASYNTFQIGTVGGEVALRLPIPVVEPYLRVGAGYAWQGDANYTVTTAGVTTQPATTVYGWAIDAALGVDIFLANWFTIGAGIGLDVLNMTRQSDPRMPCMGVTDFCPSRQGDAVGYQLSGFGQIGFHI